MLYLLEKYTKKKKSQSTSVLWWMLYWHYAQYVWDAKKKKRSKDLILLPPLLSSDGRQIIQSFLHLSSSSQEDFVKKQIQHVASSAQSIHTCISMPFNSPSNARNIHGVSAPNYLMQDRSTTFAITRIKEEERDKKSCASLCNTNIVPHSVFLCFWTQEIHVVGNSCLRIGGRSSSPA